MGKRRAFMRFEKRTVAFHKGERVILGCASETLSDVCRAIRRCDLVGRYLKIVLGILLHGLIYGCCFGSIREQMNDAIRRLSLYRIVPLSDECFLPRDRRLAHESAI